MLPVGLDLGTGFVKCTWDDMQIKFPSLYAVKIKDDWDEKSNTFTIEAVGWEAMSLMRSEGSTEIRPIIMGEPREEYEHHIIMLIQKALDNIAKTQSNGAVRAIDVSKICMVVGLPYKSTASKVFITKILRKIPQIKKYSIILQASGSFLACKKKSGMYVSIGQGTTEIIAYENKQRIFTDSYPIATEFITSKLGEYAYLDIDSLQKNMSKHTEKINQFTVSISSKIDAIQQKLRVTLPVIFSGGGIMIPGVRKAFEKNLTKYTIEVPENSDYLNAKGNLIYAQTLTRK